MPKDPLEDMKFSSHLWDAILLELDRGKLDEAIAFTSQWTDRLAQSQSIGLQGRVAELMARYRRFSQLAPAGQERIATVIDTILNTATASFQKIIDDPISNPQISAKLIVREIAALQMVTGRAPDAVQVADRAAAEVDSRIKPDVPDRFGFEANRRNEERMKAALDSVQTGLLYAVVQHPSSAMTRLRKALLLTENIWAEDKYEIGCTAFVAAAFTDAALARSAIDAAAEQAAREPNIRRRPALFANLAYYAAMNGEMRRAVSLINRAGDPTLTSYIYALVLDRIILKASPDIHRTWGFAELKWRVVIADYVKAQSIPSCGVD